jgi:hypothetical protein
MISGIRHYHYSTRNLSITLEQSTWLARAHMSSGVLEHLHVSTHPTGQQQPTLMRAHFIVCLQVTC